MTGNRNWRKNAPRADAVVRTRKAAESANVAAARIIIERGYEGLMREWAEMVLGREVADGPRLGLEGVPEQVRYDRS